MEFLERISQYNVVNYFVPGVVFSIMSDRLYGIDIAGDDVLLGVFVYYFVGMCLSRVGSLVVEPFLKWVGFVQFSDYGDYLVAEKADPKIPVLLETANFYRSILGGVLAFLALGLASFLISKGQLSESLVIGGVVIIVLVLIALGYRKQVDYIRKRVERRVSENADS